MMTKGRTRAVIGVILAVALVLGYGYWRTTTHAWLVLMVSDAVTPGVARMDRLSLRFLDAQGQLLATVSVDGKGEHRYQDTPFGDCAALARLAYQSGENHRRWRQCAEIQSRWVSDWAPRARTLELTLDQCLPQRVDALFHTVRDEWWLWWVPLPHVGGLPSTTHQLDILVDTGASEIRLRTLQGTTAATRS